MSTLTWFTALASDQLYKVFLMFFLCTKDWINFLKCFALTIIYLQELKRYLVDKMIYSNILSDISVSEIDWSISFSSEK